jgi:hypothetical protein
LAEIAQIRRQEQNVLCLCDCRDLEVLRADPYVLLAQLTKCIGGCGVKRDDVPFDEIENPFFAVVK